LLGVELTTSRIKCATLPLEALQGLLGVYDWRLEQKRTTY
jgi:hypothetical protein